MPRFALALVLALAACNALGVPGSGRDAHQRRQVAPFDEVELAGALDVHISAGREQEIAVDGDDNLVPLVTTKVEGHRLRIATSKAVRPKLPLVVHVAAPHVVRVVVSGAGTAKLGGVAGGEETLELGGAGRLVAKGTADHVAIDLSGAGTIDASLLQAARVDVTVSGAGNAEVYASQALSANISGAGSVRYAGHPPDAKKTVSGAGSIAAE